MHSKVQAGQSLWYALQAFRAKGNTILCIYTGCFFLLVPPKKLEYGKHRLGESTLT